MKHQSDAIVVPGFSHISTKVHKVQVQRPKMTTIVSMIEARAKTGHIRGKSSHIRGKSSNFRGKSSNHKTYTNHDKNPNELRLTRHTNTSLIYDDEPMFGTKNKNTNEVNINIEQFYKIPPSKFFPPIDDHDLQSLEQKSNSNENTIIIPEMPKLYENLSTIMKGIFIKNPKDKTSVDDKIKTEKPLTVTLDFEPDQEKADFLLQGSPAVIKNFLYNSTVNPYICLTLKETRTDIDSQRRFSEFDIEVDTK